MVKKPKNIKNSYISNIKVMISGFDKLKCNRYYSCFTHNIIIKHIRKNFKIVFMIKVPYKLDLGRLKILLNKKITDKELVEQYFIVFYKGVN